MNEIKMYNFTFNEILYELKCIVIIEPLFKRGHWKTKETLAFINSILISYR